MDYLLLVEAIFPKKKKNLVNSLNNCQHFSEFFFYLKSLVIKERKYNKI